MPWDEAFAEGWLGHTLSSAALTWLPSAYTTRDENTGKKQFYVGRNFGEVEIDFEQNLVMLRARDARGDVALERSYFLKDLGGAAERERSAHGWRCEGHAGPISAARVHTAAVAFVCAVFAALAAAAVLFVVCMLRGTRALGGGGSGGLHYSLVFKDLIRYSVLSLRRSLRRRLSADAADCALLRLPTEHLAAVVDDCLITVVIPAFNEGGDIADTVRSALREALVEVLVVDGGSTDGTVAAAEAAGARVVRGRGGRAGCQNVGAAASSAPLLLFLHADTILPEGWARLVRRELRSEDVGLVAFRLRLTPRLPGISWIEWGANRRAERKGTPYGDQSLGMRREVFEALGGFPQQPILEDLDLVLQIRSRAEVRILAPCVVSSSRRWEINGVIGNTVRNQLVLVGHALGVPITPNIVQWYYGASGKKSY